MSNQSAIERSSPFLFKAIPPNSGLKRDEPSLIVRVLCLGIFFLAAIDIAVIVFYYRTSARINVIRNDNFTEVIVTNLEESNIKHDTFASQAKEIIRNKNSNIKEFIDHMEYDSKAIDKIDKQYIALPTLPALIERLREVETSKQPDLAKLKDTTRLYNQVEAEFKKVMSYLAPVKEFNSYQTSMEKTLQSILDEIGRNLNNFKGQLDDLGKRQGDAQVALMQQIKQTLQDFDETYKFVVKEDGTYRKLNNYYQVEFLDFDRDYVPFSTEFETSVDSDSRFQSYSSSFGAALTKETVLKLDTPRTYFCTLELYLFSENPFSVRMQYVDKPDDENEKDLVLFETESIQGGMMNRVAYSDIKVFKLEAGWHNLYLRTVSEGYASMLEISSKRMVCLSYRNFRAGADPIEEPAQADKRVSRSSNQSDNER